MNTKVKDQLYRQSMDAIYTSYVTIIHYCIVPHGTSYIGGQTFDHGNLIGCYSGK